MAASASNAREALRRLSPEELLARAEAALKSEAKLRTHNEYLERENGALRAERKALLHRLFGRKSENVEALQGNLFDESRSEIEADLNLSQGEEDSILEPANPPARRRTKRKESQAHLPRHRQVYEISEQDRHCSCCDEVMQPFGEEVTEQLDYIPAQLRILEQAKVKYACSACKDGGVRTAEAPDRPIPKVHASAALISYITTSKYSEHLPLYRQERIFERLGAEISRQTMAGWLGAAADLLEPVVTEMRRDLLKAPLIQSDDTPIRYQDRRLKGKTGRGYLWAYCLPWAEVVYDFREDRSRAGPLEFLAGYRGAIQADGYSGYNELFRQDGTEHVACMAHIRRKIFESRGEYPDRAKVLLAGIQQLYRIERRAKRDAVIGDALVELRREKSVPIFATLQEAMTEWSSDVLPRSGFGKALRYALDQWPSMLRYVEVPESELDNNSCESAIRPVALGRKNWLFAGSAEGGRRAALLYSLVTTCKRLEVNPQAYLTDVISRIGNHKVSAIAELTPRAWRDARL